MEATSFEVEKLSEQTKTCSVPSFQHDNSRLKIFLSERLKKLHTDLKDNGLESCESVSELNNDLRIFVKKIDFQISEKILGKFFSKFGEVSKAKIYRDTKVSGGFKLESKGCGWVKFVQESGFAKALAAEPSQLLLKNRIMIVDRFQKTKINFKTNEYIKEDLVSLDLAIKHNKMAHVNSLPVDVLTTIFSELCIRDLCIVEQGKYSMYFFDEINFYLISSKFC